MKILINFFAVIIALSFVHSTVMAQNETSDRISRDAIVSAEGIILTSKDRLSTPGSFQPPVEITIVAKTDSTNLRIAYAADQVIFNWEGNDQDLRVDGGPAGGKHKSGAGAIPTDQYVAIKWIVTSKKQSIYVGNELRYEDKGDYSHIDNCVSVFSAGGSKVTVKSIYVKRLPTDTK
jgi:hypothetical protein